jgi:hypothetical protein
MILNATYHTLLEETDEREIEATLGRLAKDLREHLLRLCPRGKFKTPKAWARAMAMKIKKGLLPAATRFGKPPAEVLMGRSAATMTAGCLVIAQAEFEVLRVRAVVRAVFADLLNGLPSAGPTAGPDSEKQAAQPLLAGEKLRPAAADLARGIDQLSNLNRYLRRVLAQRDRAVRLALEHGSDPSA